MDSGQRQFPPGHFRAEVRMLTKEEGGRSIPALTGWRCPLNMGVTGMFNDCWVEFKDRDKLLPGESCLAEIGMIAPKFQIGRLYPGFEFSLHDGWRKVGNGTIIEVLKPELLRELHR